METVTSWKPAEMTPESAGTAPGVEGLAEFLADAPRLAGQLIAAGALVFRGFGVREPELPALLDLLLPGRLAYVHGNTPRTRVGDNLYTSTEYPAAYDISMHNEMSYAARWPSRLFFFCAQAPGTGGATPVLDGRTWLEALDPEVREAFAGGVRYTQNLHSGHGLGKSWQETFETADRDRVQEFLADAEAEWEWTADGGLRVSMLRPATVRHPVTGAEVWFNQADQWHPASLGDETALELAQLLPESELPQSVRYADGSPIPAEHVLHVREVGLRRAVDVNWAEGDLMLVENVLAAHGRRSFTGSRRILVAMD